MDQPFLDRLARQCDELRTQGLYKPERVLGSPQQPVVRLADGRELINLCANNYLALANHPSIREAAHRALDRHGYGMASVRFICGTQSVHAELERRMSAFLGTEDTILYSSCFDANGGIFEPLLWMQSAPRTKVFSRKRFSGFFVLTTAPPGGSAMTQSTRLMPA